MKKLMIIASCALLLLAAGCKNDPESLFGKENKPGWQKPSQYDYSSSMTAVVRIDLRSQYGTLAVEHQVESTDVLAAFIGDKCCGVVNPTDSIFYLFVADVASNTNATERKVSLRYWSAYYRNIFIANEVFTFVNDSRLGDADHPIVPKFVKKEN